MRSSSADFIRYSAFDIRHSSLTRRSRSGLVDGKSAKLRHLFERHDMLYWSRFAALLLIAATQSLFAAEPLAPKVENDVAWYDAKALGIEGQGWTDTKLPYDRFPAKAEATLRPDVWNLSRHSAGMAFRFVTASPTIHARWTVTSDRLAMPHMPATGVSGLDLYAKDDAGKWRWVAVGQPKEKTNTAILANGIKPGPREYLIYLPLYNGVAQVEVGVPMSQTIERPAEYPAAKAKPIVFYGTSITHGGVRLHGRAWSTPQFSAAGISDR
ncbi:MAG: SGNH/GDSL hydrolase family protein [Microthrixaceae bacterium]